MDLATFDFDYSERRDFTFGLFSDVHIDSPACDRELFKSDLDRLADRNGRAWFNGDLIDAIFPTDRKRYARSGDGLTTDGQVNETIELAVETLKPYANICDFFGMGNHEASALRFNNIDILRLIVDSLQQFRDPKLPKIQRGGYVGFIHLVFRRGDGAVRRYVVYRDHGKGGASPVTKGMIGLNRMAVSFVYDLGWQGHSHQDVIDLGGWSIDVTATGKIRHKRKLAVVTPGYSRNFQVTDTNNGNYARNYPEESFYGPTGLGCHFLALDLTGDEISARIM